MASHLVLGGVVVAGVTALGVGLLTLREPSAPTAEPVAPEIADTATPEGTVVASVTDQVAGRQEAPKGSGDVAAAEAAPTPQATPDVPDDAAMPEPRFDVVRVDPGGSALVAGSAGAHQQVILRLDGEEIATVQSDGAGNFVSLFNVPPTDAPRLLTVEIVAADGTVTRAEESIIVAPTFPTEPATGDSPNIQTAAVDPARDADQEPAATALTEGATSEPGQPASIDTADPIAPESTAPEAAPSSGTVVGVAAAPQPSAPPTPPSGENDAAPDIATAAPRSPRLFRAGPSGVQALDTASAEEPEATQSLGIDAIAYDAQGDVQLSGRGAQDEEVRVYLNNRPVQSGQVREDGSWAVDLPDVDTGVYTLRIDAVDGAGTVTSRIETPFERTAPEIAAQLRAQGVNVITVQPGFTLWAISEGYFGEGLQYVQIFEANRSLIRDPDLIYPGQVFALPEDGPELAEN